MTSCAWDDPGVNAEKRAHNQTPAFECVGRSSALQEYFMAVQAIPTRGLATAFASTSHERCVLRYAHPVKAGQLPHTKVGPPEGLHKQKRSPHAR